MARYIDADVLHIKMEDLYEHHIEMKNFSADGAVADCLELLDNTPTADVVEVRHGKWIAHNKTMYGSDYSCSLCGNIADEDNRGKFAILTKYCSNCGAKMDGGKEE